MPYEYYTLPFCKPSKAGLQSENLGEVLSGDRIENSVYKVKSPFLFFFCGFIFSCLFVLD
jgi:transmembrane 9 superfamily protein 2/4